MVQITFNIRAICLNCNLALRSTAQLISYELILSSAILLVVLLAGSLDITVIIEAQRAI
jgi:NADH-ubiquinone oxidoreductase chain 1